MRTFTYPAAYQRYLESQMTMAVAAIGRDVTRRAVGDYETIPDAFVDPIARGQAVAIVGAFSTEYETAHAVEALFTLGALP